MTRRDIIIVVTAFTIELLCWWALGYVTLSRLLAT